MFTTCERGRWELTMADGVRHALIARTCLEVLRDSAEAMRPADAIAEVARRLGDLTDYESERQKGGRTRWENSLQWGSGDLATIGWITKSGGWRITDSGIQALETYPDAESLQKALLRLREQIYRERKRAVEQLAPFEQEITAAIGEVSAGQWTSYEDVAAIAGTTAETAINFLAKQRVPNAHRVLREDGTPPPEGMLHQWLRGWNILEQLAKEGVEVDDSHASQDQRVTADELRAHIEAFTQLEQEGRPRSAWLVRGTVDGENLVPAWLSEGYVSLAASRLSSGMSTASRETIEAAVKEAYDFKTYAQLDRLVREFNAFLRLMRPEDYVVTVDGGRLFVGEITGGFEFTDSAEGRSNLRRPVRWLNPDAPVDYSELDEQFVNKLSDQSHVVNLTDVADLVDTLVRRPADERTPVTKPEARLAPVTAELAEQLYLHDQAWLEEVAELLADKRQIVLYGPPGTGKTYLATHLARHLAGGEQAVRLVQFHPSYTYEDFFEGYRPKTVTGGQLSFELRPGPLRALADRAREDPGTAYILVIDEINRANLAKVFGELYFLLEYRTETIGLQYSPDEWFSLPKNLFVIGTMNTADRSIALVDTAMRRRFAFIELHPHQEPVAGLLRRWLARHRYGDEPARLLDALNDRLTDRDYAIGPSYLMKDSVHTRNGGLERVWRTEILPLLEELHYGEAVDVADRYGLSALRARIIGSDPDLAETVGEAQEPR
jgi:5-methylcytosine-specific restriction enzyme B